MPADPAPNPTLPPVQRASWFILGICMLGAIASGYVNFGQAPRGGWLVDVVFLICTVGFLASLLAMLRPHMHSSTRQRPDHDTEPAPERARG